MHSTLHGAPTVHYTVATVAQRLGIATPTLRSWTRRYGIGPDGHRPGTHRHYTETDIAILERMLELMRAGATPRSAARTALQNAQASPPLLGDMDAVIEAAFRLDSDEVDAILRASLARAGVLSTWDTLCRPALEAIQQRHNAGQECIDVEYVLARTIAIALQRVATTDRAPSPPVLLACTRGEFHTLPLEALRAALAERGQVSTMLGASVPASAVRDALTRDTAPRAVVVWSQTDHTARTSALHRAGAGDALVVAAGPGWADAEVPDGVVVVNDLLDLLDTLDKLG